MNYSEMNVNSSSVTLVRFVIHQSELDGGGGSGRYGEEEGERKEEMK